MPVLPGEVMMATDMDYDSIAKAGSMLGSGAVIVMDETRCMVRSLLRLAYFYYEESCGQCTPCRQGTGWAARVLHRIVHGGAGPRDVEEVIRIANGFDGKTICALADACAIPIRSYIEKFGDEFERHVRTGTCDVPGHEAASCAGDLHYISAGGH